MQEEKIRWVFHLKNNTDGEDVAMLHKQQIKWKHLIESE